mgnify:CR=1 FL=1
MYQYIYATAVIVGVLVTVAFMYLILGKIGGKSGKYFAKNQTDIAKINGYIEEIMNGQKVVKVFNHEDKVKEEFDLFKNIPHNVLKYVETQVKYDGYLKRQNLLIEQMKKNEDIKLEQDFDYSTIKGLRLEAQQKLNKFKPLSLGQASRISGVSPADISVLTVYLSMQKRLEKK